MKLAAFRPDIADGAMLAVVLMWAANNILIKTSVVVIPPLPFVVVRLAIVIALVWAWIAVRRMPASIGIRDLPLLILTGVAGFGIYNALFTIGIERTSSFSVALLLSLSPVLTLLIARGLGIERLSRAQWLAVLLAVAGVALFVGDKLHAEGFGQAAVGDLLALGAALAFAIYSIAARPLTGRYGATVTTAWAATIGLLAVAPWGMAATFAYSWTDLSLPIWAALFYAAAISMLVGYTLWSWAIARGGIVRTVPYLFLVPVVTGTLSALLLGEVFTPLKLAGGVLVLVGTALVRLLGSLTVPRWGQTPPEPLLATAAPRAESAGGD